MESRIETTRDKVNAFKLMSVVKKGNTFRIVLTPEIPINEGYTEKPSEGSPGRYTVYLKGELNKGPMTYICLLHSTMDEAVKIQTELTDQIRLYKERENTKDWPSLYSLWSSAVAFVTNAQPTESEINKKTM